jgi:ABC-type branched-subunit amino acid transport system ATPase component
VVDAIESGYGRVKVLHGVSLELHAGEVVCIIGPNGAGKTTLLRTISGLCRPTGGAIAFKGAALAGAKPHQMARRGLGHCPEGRRVFQHLSIEENLIAGFLTGRAKARTDLFDEVYALFPILGERHRQAASRLSGGQQQMLAIGRALMGNPELLLLDVPSLGLARGARSTCPPGPRPAPVRLRRDTKVWSAKTAMQPLRPKATSSSWRCVRSRCRSWSGYDFAPSRRWSASSPVRRSINFPLRGPRRPARPCRAPAMHRLAAGTDPDDAVPSDGRGFVR